MSGGAGVGQQDAGRPGLPAGVPASLIAAVLFGASTPLSKWLLETTHPVLLAGLLYLGSGIGLTVLRLSRGLWLRLHHSPLTPRHSEAPLTRADLPWLAGAVFFGGIAGPVLQMVGLAATPAATASLLLNLEGVFTALLAWFLFHENFDRRIAAGMAAIVAGGLLLSWQNAGGLGLPWGSLAIIGACACWGIDNNLTQKVSAGDPTRVTAIKGAAAGSVNLALAFALGARLPAAGIIARAGMVGFLGYGLSLVLFVLALRQIGTARTGAYFSLAPFVGATLSLLMFHERAQARLVGAAALMGLGIWLHLTERHEHPHQHEALTHEHRHVHDAHHRHEHPPGVDPRAPHSHPHTHPPMRHAHPHYPDIHHRHHH